MQMHSGIVSSCGREGGRSDSCLPAAGTGRSAVQTQQAQSERDPAAPTPPCPSQDSGLGGLPGLWGRPFTRGCGLGRRCTCSHPAGREGFWNQPSTCHEGPEAGLTSTPHTRHGQGPLSCSTGWPWHGALLPAGDWVAQESLAWAPRATAGTPGVSIKGHPEPVRPPVSWAGTRRTRAPWQERSGGVGECARGACVGVSVDSAEAHASAGLHGDPASNSQVRGTESEAILQLEVAWRRGRPRSCRC